MKKGIVFTTVAGLILASASASSPAAAQSVVDNLSPPEVTDCYQASYGILNLKFFEVEAEDAGEFYPGFWLQPTCYADGTYTTFYVYLDNAYIGKVSATTGGWQSATLDDGQKLQLQKGTNTIAVATVTPEVPEVELVKLATRTEDSNVSSDAYDAFMAEAAAGITYDIPQGEEVGISINANLPNPTLTSEKCFYNVPLLYTSYRIFTFEVGTDVIVTTTSEIAHELEVIYYGTQFGPHQLPPPPLVNEEELKVGPPIYELLPDMTSLAKANFNKPSSKEMQIYSWHCRSKNDNDYKREVDFNVPKYGMYFVRVRSRDNGVLGTASLKIEYRSPEDDAGDNKEEDATIYNYVNLPISSSIVDCTIPDDGNEYASLAKGENSGKDDPIIFIHNNDGKLLGIDDDSYSWQQENYNLPSWMDSFISQTYIETVKHISVSSYRSLNPKSTCDIRACILVDDKNTAKGKRGISKNVGSLISDDSVVIPTTLNRDSPLTVTSPFQIRKVSAYNLLGRLTGSVVSHEESVDISISDLNITAPGVYILSVETDKETISRKVFVK